MSSFEELVRVLEQLCKPLDNADLVSFEAAIAFGKICVKNVHAVEKMLSYLNTGDDTHKKAVVRSFFTCFPSIDRNSLRSF